MRPGYILSMNALNMASDHSSSAIYTAFSFNASVVVTCTGASPDGTLKIQVSNDESDPLNNNSVTNWVDLASAAVTTSSAANFIIPAQTMCYNFMRLVFTNNSGTGTITAKVKLNNV